MVCGDAGGGVAEGGFEDDWRWEGSRVMGTVQLPVGSSACWGRSSVRLLYSGARSAMLGTSLAGGARNVCWMLYRHMQNITIYRLLLYISTVVS